MKNKMKKCRQLVAYLYLATIAQASATTTWYLDDAASACAQTPVICPARVELASARVGVVWLDNSNSTILHEIYEELLEHRTVRAVPVCVLYQQRASCRETTGMAVISAG